MAADDSEKTGTKYVVLREVDPKIFEGDVIASADMHVFVTDGRLSDPMSADQAIKLVAVHAGEGVYATVPERSWDPAPYEVETSVTVRRKAPAPAAS